MNIMLQSYKILVLCVVMASSLMPAYRFIGMEEKSDSPQFIPIENKKTSSFPVDPSPLPDPLPGSCVRIENSIPKNAGYDGLFLDPHGAKSVIDPICKKGDSFIKDITKGAKEENKEWRFWFSCQKTNSYDNVMRLTLFGLPANIDDTTSAFTIPIDVLPQTDGGVLFITDKDICPFIYNSNNKSYEYLIQQEKKINNKLLSTDLLIEKIEDFIKIILTEGSVISWMKNASRQL